MTNTVLTVFYGLEEREDIHGNETAMCFGFFETYDPAKAWAEKRTDALDFNHAKTAKRCIYRVDVEVIREPYAGIFVNEVIFPIVYLVTVTQFSAGYINPPGALLSVSAYVKETPVYISDNCYYCASDWVSVVSTHANFGTDVLAYVKCSACGASGPICCGENSVTDAINAWNKTSECGDEYLGSACKFCDGCDVRHDNAKAMNKYFCKIVEGWTLNENNYNRRAPIWCPLTTRKGKE